MNKRLKNKILKKAEIAERKILNGQSDLSAIVNDIQPFFKQEIDITWSTDGAVITDNNGEVDFLDNFLNNL